MTTTLATPRFIQPTQIDSAPETIAHVVRVGGAIIGEAHRVARLHWVGSPAGWTQPHPAVIGSSLAEVAEVLRTMAWLNGAVA